MSKPHAPSSRPRSSKVTRQKKNTRTLPNQAPGVSELLTTEQVAAILGMKPQSLRIRRLRGAGPPFVRLTDSPTAHAFYRRTELNAWLEALPSYRGTGEEVAARAEQAARP